jgi:hypothetical protein
MHGLQQIVDLPRGFGVAAVICGTCRGPRFIAASNFQGQS